jgi:hypothetical protein
MRHKPALHLHGVRRKSLVAAALAVTGFAGLAFAQVTPAMADPTMTYVAVGSDTIQDVDNQFAIDAGGNLLGSYNAVNPVTQVAHEIITPTKVAGTNCSFTRPNGSGEGVAALGASTGNPNTPAPAGTPPQAGCVDIARSSSGPATSSPNGAFVYIPFAIDAVAGSTGPATAGTLGGVNAVATNITQANLFSKPDLVNLYACNNVTVNGVTYNPNTAAAGQQQIDLYIPQPGSGTRKFWEGQLSITSDNPLPACVHDHIVAGASTGASVEEHDGTAVATDANGFGPFSAAQWIAQRNGHNDRRHGAQLANLAATAGGTAVSPFTGGNPATGSLNLNFPIVREVFNVVPFAKVSGAGADPGLVSLFVGTGSTTCSDSLQIRSYGFATLPATSTTFDPCGSIANPTLRAF